MEADPREGRTPGGVTEMAETVLELEDLTVRFRLKRGDLTAVNGVSFGIERGETFGLVGESGSGKSVTARAIMLKDRKAIRFC